MALKVAVIITRADDLGGAQSHVRDLALELKARGNDVTVFAGSEGALFEALKPRAIDCRVIDCLVHPIAPLKDLQAYYEIKARIKELKPDLVSTHSNKAGFLGRLAADALGIPVVHTSHGFLFGGRRQTLTGRFYRLMEKFAAAWGDMVIAVSQSEHDLAAGLGVIPSHKMTVVYNGLPEMAEAGRTANPETEPARLIMIARFEKPKDHLTLIRALGGLKEMDWQLTLVGDGKGRAAAESMAAELGLSERLEFTGTRRDTEALLGDSSIFILSSRREGFPISILEAMRAGLPVVATRVGGIPEAVIEGETGLLFDPGDEAALRQQLAKLIADPALRKKMGLAGQKSFREHFTLKQMVDQTEKVYLKILGQHD